MGGGGVFHSPPCCRYFNEITSGNPSSPSPSPTRRSLSPSPALLATAGYPPSPLRSRAQSFEAYPHPIHLGNFHIPSMSSSHVGMPGAPMHSNGGASHNVEYIGSVSCTVALFWQKRWSSNYCNESASSSCNIVIIRQELKECSTQLLTSIFLYNGSKKWK